MPVTASCVPSHMSSVATTHHKPPRLPAAGLAAECPRGSPSSYVPCLCSLSSLVPGPLGAAKAPSRPTGPITMSLSRIHSLTGLRTDPKMAKLRRANHSYMSLCLAAPPLWISNFSLSLLSGVRRLPHPLSHESIGFVTNWCSDGRLR